ncbi:MAG: YfhO family protein [Thermomicrobiales bacterium]
MNGSRQDYHWLDTFAPALGDAQLLDMLNVRYILVDASIPENRSDYVEIARWNTEVYRDDLVVVFENKEVFPHAWIVHDVQDNGGTGYGLRMLGSGNTNGRFTAYVNMDSDIPDLKISADGGKSDVTTLVRYEPEHTVLSTRSQEDGFLVISDPYATGWNAYIDGQETPVIRTNHALRGVFLPAGEHTVELKYEPESLEIGLMVSGGVSVAMISIWSWALVDWRRRGTTGVDGRANVSAKPPSSPEEPPTRRPRRSFMRSRRDT